MATTDPSNRRMAIQSLLNETGSESSHSRSGSSSQQRPYSCDLCDKRLEYSFTQRADVRKHKSTVHMKARDFHCPSCGLKFGERGNLNKHVKSIHLKERNFRCEQCDASFPFRNGLTEHIRMRHTDDRPYECGKCGSSFKKKSHLQRHSSVVHKTTS